MVAAILHLLQEAAVLCEGGFLFCAEVLHTFGLLCSEDAGKSGFFGAFQKESSIMHVAQGSTEDVPLDSLHGIAEKEGILVGAFQKESSIMHVAQGSTEDVPLDSMHGIAEKEDILVCSDLGHACTLWQIRGGSHQELPAVRVWSEEERRHCKKMKQHNVWSVNSGGLDGAWRVLHMLDAEDTASRPAILCLQEVGCSEQQWLSMQHFLRLRGYNGFCTGAKQPGETAKGWHRAVATFVADFIPVNFNDEYTWSGGQFHLIQVGHWMLANYYVSPTEDHKAKQMAMFNEHWISIQCAGKWLWVGDFNEVYYNSWIATVAALNEGAMTPFCEGIESTRWQGNRLIDMVISNCCLNSISVKEERISDHKVLEFSLELQQHGQTQTRLVKDIVFDMPMWLCEEQWQRCFDDAVIECDKKEWSTAFEWADKYMEWTNEEEEGQQAVELSWCVMLAKITWSFSVACQLALLLIPEGYENVTEMRRVMNLANRKKIKGMEVKVQDRDMPKAGHHKGQLQRKQYRKMGKLAELEKKLTMGKSCNETRELVKKLFHCELDEISLLQVQNSKQMLDEEIKSRECRQKHTAIARWKFKMHNDIQSKTGWLNKKGNGINAMVQTDTCTAKSKVEAVQLLRQYWTELWDRQKWTDDDRKIKSKEVIDILKPLLEGYKPKSGRPEQELLAQKMGKIAGCAGPDGWARNELKVISKNDFLTKLIWENMQLWERFESIPQAVGHCVLAHVPKKKMRHLGPHQFRPICVMSCWWRIWSMAWLNSPWVRGWAEAIFPSTVAGGMPGAFGPEKMASIVAHQLQTHQKGLTLDFKHAFDCVDLKLMEQILCGCLPSACHPWCKLLIKQWCTMRRWIVYDACTEPAALVSQQGLPQGDPAAALMMTTLNLGLMKMVERDAGYPQNVFHTIYMDDRTIVAEEEDVIEQMKTSWKHTSERYHLIENEAKAQKVDSTLPGSSFEVLGALLGNPSKGNVSKSRLQDRNTKVNHLYRKVGILPQGMGAKMRDCSMYGRSLLAYGWIDVTPPDSWVKAQHYAFWRTAARTGYANPHMKKVVCGAHSAFDMVVFLRQLRLLAQRDRALNLAHIPIEKCKLDNFVETQLEKLNWTLERGRYRHPLYREGFKICELVDSERWKCIAHHIRESYRKLEFDFYKQSSRHEVNCYVYEPYDPERRKLAVRWAKDDSIANLLLIGGIQSPKVKFNTRGIQQNCSKCGCSNPDWEHLRIL